MALKKFYTEIFSRLKMDELVEQKMILMYASISEENLSKHLSPVEEKGLRAVLNTLIEDSRRHERAVSKLMEKYGE